MRKPNEITAKLLKMAAENPTLPIVAMVDFEVVAGDDFAYWTGEIESVAVEELWLSPDARTWEREEAESEYEEFMEAYASNEEQLRIQCWTDDKLHQQAARERSAGLPWTKCIVIFVDTPDKLTRKGERKWEENRD